LDLEISTIFGLRQRGHRRYVFGADISVLPGRVGRGNGRRRRFFAAADKKETGHHHHYSQEGQLVNGVIP
jgi:hypothetical protein